MTVYPDAIDDDRTIIRIDDNIQQLGSEVINQLREAVFAMQSQLGIIPAGSAGSVVNRLDRSLNADGTIKQSALAAVGLVTLPITNNQVGSTAGILESKLALNHSTSDLFTALSANTIQLTSLSTFATTINSDLIIHILGGSVLSDGTTPARHVSSQIDLNKVPSDSRDPSYVWSGLIDKDGNLRSGTEVATALLQINNALVNHQNAISLAHVATAISVDTSSFTEIPEEADNVQLAFEALDDSDRLQIGIHRAVMHDNSIPRTARSQLIGGPDGYSVNVVPPTLARAFLMAPPASGPVDNNTKGDDIVKFFPDNTGFTFDSQFSAVRPGDVVRINYGNGLTGRFLVESSRFTPGSDWVVRLNGTNITNADGYSPFTLDGYDAYARIDRPLFDTSTFGVFACASANNDIDFSIRSSIIVGNPRAASALGVGFDPNKLDTTHYNLYLNLYPTGNPTEVVEQLPAIDVTGNAGITPGKYTLRSVIDATNNSLRASGYNLRFIAFNHEGNFGIMLADPINVASFSIINGIVSGSTLAAGSFSNNVIGDAVDGLDALGLGQTGINVASPDYNASFSSSAQAANLPTIILNPLKGRNAIINGARRDTFAEGYKTVDGYWEATVTARDLIGVSTVEVEYEVTMDLAAAGLAVGKTITVQPVLDYDDGSYLPQDYGRFIIKALDYDCPCPGDPVKTIIRVINGVHATGNPISAGSGIGLAVKIYFGEDSVGFNASNVVDTIPSGIIYNRYHEIFIDDSGTTFSHERARMPKQAGLSPELATVNNWTIKDVSPKLRGYRDADGSTDFRRFVRLYILSYDSTSGEFDGYIGARSPVNADIFDFGEISVGRKNVPVKFYDSSNVDFIEIEFTENGTFGTPILTTPASAYVDIEVFPTLRLDDELFLLASCELDNNSVECVSDRREFGSVSEKNFSFSAIDFIQSGERFLHANGIVKGFEFDGVSTSDTATLEFSGGIALVNGGFQALDDGSVRIPQVRLTTTPLGSTLDWAICVNENGNLIAIVLTADKTEFFATTDGIDSYYIESVTFSELVTVRKDLTPIAIATVTIASLTVNQVLDARRFVRDETLDIPLSWTPTLINNRVNSGLDQQVTGNFATFEAVRSWINGYGATDNTVIIKGMIDITESLNLTVLEQAVVFEGNGSTSGFRIAGVNQGIIIGSNQTFRNLYVNYTPDSGAYTNRLNDGNGAFYRSVGTSTILENILIENCTFEVGEFGAHPPHINIDIGDIGVVDSFVVRDCHFIDYNIAAQLDAAAVAIVGQLAVGPTISNVLIENNRCNLNQGFYLVTSGTDFPGMSAYNCLIRGNQAGIIGYSIGSSDNATSLTFSGADDANDVWRASGLTISENNVAAICSCNEEGTVQPGPSFSTGHVLIDNNKANWIIGVHVDQIEALAMTPLFRRSTLKIRGNTLTGFDPAVFTDLHGVNSAIFVGTNGSVPGAFQTCVEISGNSIDFGTNPGETTSSFGYAAGITSGNPTLITDNVIRGLLPGTVYGIGALDLFGFSTVTDNIITRGVNDILSYVAAFGDCKIVDNMFDNFEVSAGFTSTIFTLLGTNLTAERNINQTKEIQLDPSSKGMVSIGLGLGSKRIIPNPTASFDSFIQARLAGGVTLSYREIVGIRSVIYRVALDEVLSEESRIIALEVDFIRDIETSTSTYQYIVTLTDRLGVLTPNSTGIVPFPAGSGVLPPVSLPITSNWKDNGAYILEIQSDVESTSDKDVDIVAVRVTIRY